MMEDVEDNLLSEGSGELRESIDLNSSIQPTLVVDISDALSEKDRVKFTVHTKTTMPGFTSPDFSVMRHHEEFLWLHDTLEENEVYAGLIIPPAPPKPDFDSSRDKLQTLGELDGRVPSDEFLKMKQELEAEYLATFKKTVAMHEVFLQRLSAHHLFKKDPNFKIFLQYPNELNIRSKNNREKISGFFKSVTQSVDEVLLSNQKDPDEFFEGERRLVIDYYDKLKDAVAKGDKMTSAHKMVADSYIKLSTCLNQLAAVENNDIEKMLQQVSETLEKARKIEGRCATDEDLKLTDSLRYHLRDTQAAKHLLFRRLRLITDHDAALKQVEKLKSKNKDFTQAEKLEKSLQEKLANLTQVSKKELEDFKARKVNHFKKNFTQLAELQVKHAKSQIQLLSGTINALKETQQQQTPRQEQ